MKSKLMESKYSQNGYIRQYLKSGWTLTPLDALHRFNCFSLAQRVANLRDAGMEIETKMIPITSDGKTKYVARRKSFYERYPKYKSRHWVDEVRGI